MREEFRKALTIQSQEERLEMEALLLSAKFIKIVDDQMASIGMTKKELAKRVGTSASFITQMFMGDRQPSWKMLVKMGQALNMNFNVLTDDQIEERLNSALFEYHRRWAMSLDFQKARDEEVDPKQVLAVVEETDYALAG